MSTSGKWDSGAYSSEMASVHHCAATSQPNAQNGIRIKNFAFTRSLSDGELDKMKLQFPLEQIMRSYTAPVIHHNHHIIDIPTDHSTVSRNVPKRNIAIMKYLIPTLLVLVGIKYQPQPDNLFLGNSIQIGCFVATLCVYWPIVIILGKLSHLIMSPKLINVLNGITVACNFLSVFSLLSVLFPWHLPLPVFIASVVFGIVMAAIMLVCVCFGKEIASVVGLR